MLIYVFLKISNEEIIFIGYFFIQENVNNLRKQYFCIEKRSFFDIISWTKCKKNTLYK